jgi:hypothetical protein
MNARQVAPESELLKTTPPENALWNACTTGNPPEVKPAI